MKDIITARMNSLYSLQTGNQSLKNNMEKIVCEHRIKMRKRVKGCKSLFQNEYIPCGCGESISIILIEISII